MYPFWPLSGALQLPKWCMLITEMAHPIYRISGALTLPKSGALSITDYTPTFRKINVNDFPAKPSLSINQYPCKNKLMATVLFQKDSSKKNFAIVQHSYSFHLIINGLNS